MDDLISRQAAIEAIEEYSDRLQMVNWNENPGVPYKVHALNWCVNTIRELPPAQPEIITCIDCIHYTPLGKDKAWGRCSVHSSPTENQRMCQSCDFCAWAERRTDDEG